MSSDFTQEEILIKEAVTAGIRHIGIAVYSSGKIVKYLMNKGYSMSVARSAVSIISERGYIDDFKAARKVINARTGRKQESKRYIYQRLLNDGISRSCADQIVSNLIDDRTTCLSLLEATYPVVPDSIDEDFINAFIKKAQQRGYSPDTAMSAIREWYK